MNKEIKYFKKTDRTNALARSTSASECIRLTLVLGHCDSDSVVNNKHSLLCRCFQLSP